jgi:hypothetical protein
MRTYQLKESFFNKGLFEFPVSNFNSFDFFKYNELTQQYNEYLKCDNHDFTYKNENYPYSITQNKNGIFSGQYRLDPYFYSLKDIPFKIFMSFNLKGELCLINSHYKRVEFVENLIERARILSSNLHLNDIVPVFTEESVNGKLHIHILLFIKDHVKINLRRFVEILYYCLDRDIVYIPHGENRRKKIIQIIDTPLKAIAYTSKLKKNQLSKVFYIRNKNTEDYRKGGSFQSFRKFYLKHRFKKEPPEDCLKPSTDILKILAA